MAAFPVLTVNDLAAFSGRVAEEYTNAGYVGSALVQAELLFKLGTCLGDVWPDDPTNALLAKMAIVSMADAIYLVQPFQAVLANPFSSETIGSYSYSKVAGAVMGGLPTGITWFDIAMGKLSVCDISSGISMGGGIEMFEFDGEFTGGRNGNVRFLSPVDLNRSRQYGFDPSPGYSGAGPAPVFPGGSAGGGSGEGEFDWIDGGEI